MRADQFDAPFLESRPQRIAVSSFVVDQPFYFSTECSLVNLQQLGLLLHFLLSIWKASGLGSRLLLVFTESKKLEPNLQNHVSTGHYIFIG